MLKKILILLIPILFLGCFSTNNSLKEYNIKLENSILKFNLDYEKNIVNGELIIEKSGEKIYLTFNDINADYDKGRDSLNFSVNGITKSDDNFKSLKRVYDIKSTESSTDYILTVAIKNLNSSSKREVKTKLDFTKWAIIIEDSENTVYKERPKINCTNTVTKGSVVLTLEASDQKDGIQANGKIKEIKIDWGDGNSDILSGGTNSLKTEKKHDYSKIGNYTVEIRVYDDDNNDTLKKISINITEIKEEPLQKVLTPQISLKGTTYTSIQKVTITCATTGAQIRFTTDDSEPTELSNLYSGEITISTSLTLKAKAFKTGMTASDTVNEKYVLNLINGTIEPIIFSLTSESYNGAQTLYLSCATTDAAIRYSIDGSLVTSTSGILYNSRTGIPLAVGTWKINAIAYKDGWISYESPPKYYTIKQIVTNKVPGAPSAIYPKNGSDVAWSDYIILEWNCSDPDGDPVSVDIYTGNDSASLKYNSTIKQLKDSGSMKWSNLEVDKKYYWKAIAKDGKGGETESSVFYFRVTAIGEIASILFSLTSDSYYGTQTLFLSCITTGVSIRYSTDGSAVTSSSGTLYDSFAGISLPVGSWKINAIAYKKGWYSYVSTTKAYMIKTLINNNPPDVPSAPGPSDKMSGNIGKTHFSWDGGDKDGDPLTFDFYIGNTPSTMTLITTVGQQTGGWGFFEHNIVIAQVYYWKVVAKDNKGGETSSPIWEYIAR